MGFISERLLGKAVVLCWRKNQILDSINPQDFDGQNKILRTDALPNEISEKDLLYRHLEGCLQIVFT